MSKSWPLNKMTYEEKKSEDKDEEEEKAEFDSDEGFWRY